MSSALLTIYLIVHDDVDPGADTVAAHGHNIRMAYLGADTAQWRKTAARAVALAWNNIVGPVRQRSSVDPH